MIGTKAVEPKNDKKKLLFRTAMFQEPVLPFPIVIYKIPSEIEVAPCYKVHVNCFTYTAFAVHTFYTIFSVYTVYTLYTAYIDSTLLLFHRL